MGRSGGRVSYAVGVAAHVDLGVGEFGDVGRHRVLEFDDAPLDELEETDRGDRLGHREDAEDGVVGDRRAAFHVGHAVDIPVDLLPMADDGDEGARHLPLVDVAVGQLGDAGQSAGVETKVLGRHGPQRRTGGTSNRVTR